MYASLNLTATTLDMLQEAGLPPNNATDLLGCILDGEITATIHPYEFTCFLHFHPAIFDFLALSFAYPNPRLY